MRKIVISLMILLLALVGVSQAGNFGEFNTIVINTFKLTPGPVLNGFKMYKSDGNHFLFGVLTQDDWVVEAFVISKGGANANDFVRSVGFIYSFVQDSRHKLKGHEDAEVIMSGGKELWLARSREIIKRSYNHLYHTKLAKFDIDNIRVRAEDIGEVKWRTRQENRSYDSKKMISIKLWID